MKKLTALILLLCILASLASCSKKKGTSTPTDEKNPNTENTQNQPEAVPTIVVPEYKDYGRGTENFDVKFFNCDYAYTIDGGDINTIEYENFNAASALVNIKGVSIHPGSAKNKMINAIFNIIPLLIIFFS